MRTPRCGESRDLDLERPVAFLEGKRGGRALPGRQAKQTPDVCLPEPDPKSHFTLSVVSYVNGLIYLVCSTAQLGPTTPMLAGDS